jgi:ABC-type proline/glycine betaine transport system ATPase subunit
MFDRLKTYLRRRRIERLAAELARVRALRMSMTQQEFALRGKMAVLERSE